MVLQWGQAKEPFMVLVSPYISKSVEVWPPQKKNFLRGLTELNGLSVFPLVKCGIKKTMTDILAGDRIHVSPLLYASNAADPSARLKPGL